MDIPIAPAAWGRRWPGGRPHTGLWPYPRPQPPGGTPYGWPRILAGAALLTECDPSWFLANTPAAIDVDRLRVGDMWACPAAQWCARYPRRAGSGPGAHPLPPFFTALRRLRLRREDAAAAGLDGVDADLLTAGWQYLILALRGGTSLASLAGTA